ncbi:hypothetical protein DM02DRAFT_573917 [Periconia macrospinosa]|uniref:Ribosome biogenesis protein SLX9 n=1 Tax=Periconia macrospinosa TaxID=97972 RepID=A0A2V1D6M4_9PLEO|nr:hypothetical protein DM02DRAFT_573917 [Periconia macrospinosa]
MAPIAGKKRTTARAKTARSARPPPPTPDPTESPSLFASSKKDKRTIKHSAFVGKIEKSAAKSTKRRRPNKKLVANLESIANALPDFDDDDGKDEVEIGQAKVRRKSMKSLKSRPGAMKRKEKLEKMERDRFNANLAQMASAGNGAGSAVADRWAALKNHVQSTMEVKPEFIKK